jgi:hypothetical protein
LRKEVASQFDWDMKIKTRKEETEGNVDVIVWDDQTIAKTQYSRAAVTKAGKSGIETEEMFYPAVVFLSNQH